MTQVPMPYFTLVFERKNLPHKYFTVNNKQNINPEGTNWAYYLSITHVKKVKVLSSNWMGTFPPTG